MIEIGNNLRIIKHQGRDGATWVCQELCPVGTWKNRRVWKPVTAPLCEPEMKTWLARHGCSSAGL